MIFLLIPIPMIIGVFLFREMLILLAGARRRALERRFQSIRFPDGKTYSEIIKVVGRPNSISEKDGVKLCQWVAPGYHIALRFDEENICLGVESETAFYL